MNGFGRWTSGAVCALALAATPLLSQQTAPSEPQPAQGSPSTQGQPQTQGSPSAQDSTQDLTPAQHSPSAKDEPGAGAQVHTGTSSGLDSDTRLRNLLADHQFLRVQAQLAQLPPKQAQFYKGILANRCNDAKTSIELLEPLADQVAAGGDRAAEKLLRKALAEDYLRLGDWTKAAAAYQLLATRLDDQLTADERDEIEMPVKLLPLAKANPQMTVEPSEPFVLQVSRDPLGLIEIPVFVDARPHSWMLDPTAPFNLIARSLAREAGLKVGEESATIHTLTGRPMQVYTAVVPRFTIGGRLTLRNMTVFVFDDADYTFPRSGYQVQGVLGYPALAALGSLTITDSATIAVEPASQPPELASDPPTKAGAPALPAQKTPPGGAPFYLDGDQIVVALGKEGDERMYALDAGSQQTYLTSRYYAEHMDDFNGKRQQLVTLPGMPSMPAQSAFVADTVALEVGLQTVRVHFVQVLTQPLGQSALDDVYGVLGVDALDQLKAYTFDYRSMRFSVRPE
jgi:hypothetical protein